jgi:hypothetical protein
LSGVQRSKHRGLTASLLAFALLSEGCANSNLPFSNPFAVDGEDPQECLAAEAILDAEQAQLFREAETERAAQLSNEIARLQADLKTAEAALVEAESGLSGTHTRADAVSSLAVTRIQVERAAAQAPWRTGEISGARTKLEEAERQVEEDRFGAALFFVYRARRVAESLLAEADLVARDGNVQLVSAPRVNLRAGPSTTEAILSVLNYGTPVFPQASEGSWMLVQVSGGPAGWIHRGLVDTRPSSASRAPAVSRP